MSGTSRARRDVGDFSENIEENSTNVAEFIRYCEREIPRLVKEGKQPDPMALLSMYIGSHPELSVTVAADLKKMLPQIQQQIQRRISEAVEQERVIKDQVRKQGENNPKLNVPPPVSNDKPAEKKPDSNEKKKDPYKKELKEFYAQEIENLNEQEQKKAETMGVEKRAVEIYKGLVTANVDAPRASMFMRVRLADVFENFRSGAPFDLGQTLAKGIGELGRAACGAVALLIAQASAASSSFFAAMQANDMNNPTATVTKHQDGKGDASAASKPPVLQQQKLTSKVPTPSKGGVGMTAKNPH